MKTGINSGSFGYLPLGRMYARIRELGYDAVDHDLADTNAPCYRDAAVMEAYCRTVREAKEETRTVTGAGFNFMPLRVAAHKRLSREASCESPAPEAFPLWTLPVEFSWEVKNTANTNIPSVWEVKLANRGNEGFRFTIPLFTCT